MKDDYWPEGLAPDTEGKYTFGDLVAVKIPIEVHVEHKRKAREKSEMQSRTVKQKFKSEAKQAKVDIDDEVIEERMENEAEVFGI